MTPGDSQRELPGFGAARIPGVGLTPQDILELRQVLVRNLNV
jgi:hypothetical protein